MTLVFMSHFATNSWFIFLLAGSDSSATQCALCGDRALAGELVAGSVPAATVGRQRDGHPLRPQVPPPLPFAPSHRICGHDSVLIIMIIMMI